VHVNRKASSVALQQLILFNLLKWQTTMILMTVPVAALMSGQRLSHQINILTVTSLDVAASRAVEAAAECETSSGDEPLSKLAKK